MSHDYHEYQIFENLKGFLKGKKNSQKVEESDNNTNKQVPADEMINEDKQFFEEQSELITRDKDAFWYIKEGSKKLVEENPDIVENIIDSAEADDYGLEQ